MRPSSSPSEPPVGLFDGVLARGPVRAAVADPAWLAALLDAEATLAAAQAATGIIPMDAATAIAGACRATFDVSAIGAEAAASGNPVLPLIAAIRAHLPETAREFVHYGATSQDIVDTGAMLVAHRALGVLLSDVDGVTAALTRLAVRYRDTPMAGRTLAQHAVATTFGLKAAGWLVALREAAGRLRDVRETRLAVQLGGAAGTLASWGTQGLELVAAYASETGLAAPDLPWHTDRTRIADLATALGTLSGVVAKVAGDLVLLGQTEVAEVTEASPGGSSAMAHKRNPVAAISARASAAQAPGLVATLLAAMAHEHERAAGPWQAEWRPTRDLLTSTGSAVSWLRTALDGLRVDEAALARNLTLTGHLTTDTGLAGALVDRVVRAARRPVALHATVDGPPGAPVLVLGSSLGTTGALWQPQMAALTERFRVVRYDHRGHGKSPVPPGPYALDDLGADLLALLDTLDTPRVHLAGLSLGGMVAMWVAAHAPDRVDRLVLLCTAAKLGPPELWADRAAAVRAGGTSAVAETVVGRWFTPDFATRHAGVVGWVRQQFTSTPTEGYASCCAAIQHMDQLADLQRITAPTLVIAGAQDPSTPPELAREIVERIPDARLEIVSPAAHLANIEAPERVATLMRDFFLGET